MRVFFAWVRLFLKLMFQYRWGFLVSLLIDPIILLLNIALFTTIFSYNKTQTILNYSLPQMIWYFAAASFVWYFIWNFTDRNISAGILSGELAMDLVKPVSILRRELSFAIANRVSGVIFEFIPSVILYSLVYYPKFMTPYSMLRFFSIIVLSFFMFFLINFLIGLSAFIIQSNFALQAFKFIIISLTAGAIIPIEFFPGWLQKVTMLLPFQYLFYWPIQFFLNRDFTQDIFFFLKILAGQAGWILLLYLSCKFFWNLSIKKFCSAEG